MSDLHTFLDESEIVGIRSAYNHALRTKGNNMQIASSLVVELIEEIEHLRAEIAVDEQRVADLMNDVNKLGFENERLNARIKELEGNMLGILQIACDENECNGEYQQLKNLVSEIADIANRNCTSYEEISKSES